MDMKFCPTCEILLPVRKFRWSFKSEDRLQPCCMRCRDEYHRNLEEKKIIEKEASEYRRIMQGRAIRAVGKAIRDGILIRPDHCSNPLCNCVCKPEGHHWSYEEENWLDVIWTCGSCHRLIHLTDQSETKDIDWAFPRK